MIRRPDLVGTFKDRAEAWRTEALRFEEHQCVEVAATLRRVAEELEEDIREWGDELLTIEEASVESGYTTEYLRRLVREGKLRVHRNKGTKSRIRVWRRDLPIKRTTPPTNKRGTDSLATYNLEEDARDIAQRIAR